MKFARENECPFTVNEQTMLIEQKYRLDQLRQTFESSQAKYNSEMTLLKLNESALQGAQKAQALVDEWCDMRMWLGEPGWTYLAEYVGPDNRIVVSYPTSLLIYLSAYDEAGVEREQMFKEMRRREF